MIQRVDMPTVPLWLAALPFLFNKRGRSDPDIIVNSALAAAAAALDADCDRRDSRSRICFLLAELGEQYCRRTGTHSPSIPVTREQLARSAQFNLTKVKRVLGFLALSRVIELGVQDIRILDWPRLCKLAGFDRSRVPAPLEDKSEAEATASKKTEARQAPSETTSGDPASFV